MANCTTRMQHTYGASRSPSLLNSRRSIYTYIHWHDHVRFGCMVRNTQHTVSTSSWSALAQNPRPIQASSAARTPTPCYAMLRCGVECSYVGRNGPSVPSTLPTPSLLAQLPTCTNRTRLYLREHRLHALRVTSLTPSQRYQLVDAEQYLGCALPAHCDLL